MNQMNDPNRTVYSRLLLRKIATCLSGLIVGTVGGIGTLFVFGLIQPGKEIIPLAFLVAVAVGGFLSISICRRLSQNHPNKTHQKSEPVSIRIVKAEERFDATFFDPRTESRLHAISHAKYVCPECGFHVAFNTHDFIQPGAYQPLTEKQRIKLDQARPVNPDSIDDGFSMEEILEFACPGCEMPIRLIFLASEFAMGCYNYQLLEVVELVQHHKQLSSEEEDSSGGLKDFV